MLKNVCGLERKAFDSWRAGPASMAELYQQMQSSINFGMMNSLRTGNVLFDLAVCMLVPAVMQFILQPSGDDPWYSRVFRDTKNFYDYLRGREEYERLIKWTNENRYRYGRSAIDSTEKNNILQKALRLYISEMKQVKIESAEVFLFPVRAVKYETESYYDYSFAGSYKQLDSLDVTYLPQVNHWVIVDDTPGKAKIYFRQEKEEPDEDDADSGDGTTITYAERCL